MNSTEILSFRPDACDEKALEQALFGRLASDLEAQGYSILPAALSGGLAESLAAHQQHISEALYRDAGIGRGPQFLKNEFVRTDEICWINGESAAGREWLGWTSRLQSFLNRQLFLGLFSFESHYAHYRPGDYYKRHYDAFRGEANRVLSLVLYLNSAWQADDGGELVLYRDDGDRDGTRVVPLMGTLVAFLSEEFPHEVLPAVRDRHSIAGWFRLNTTCALRVDPPR